MSIPSSYLTTTAWEKFVAKYDDFMRNSKTKIKSEKTNTKLCFRTKWWIFIGIWILFALALPTHVFDPFLSILFYYRMISVRQHDLNRLVCTSSAGLHWTHGGRVNLMTWRIRPGSVPTLHVRDLSGPHRSFIAFTPSASVEGGCKRIGRIPRVMRSHSW